MKCKLFLTIVILTTMHQSFSMTSYAQRNLNDQLVEAALQGNNTKVDYLFLAGADIDAKNNSGFTPLHWATINGRKTTVEQLLAHGAAINAKDNNGWTSLHWAAVHGNIAIIELLLTKDANINAKASNDRTPLHYAAMHGYTATVELLKAYLALLEQAKNPTKALLKVAIEHGYYSLVKLLLQRGLKPDASDLQLAKAKWQTAKNKKSYEAIGRLLIKKLSLLPNVKNAEGIPVGGLVSKSGIVGLYGLPEDIAEEIAKHL